MKKKTSNLYAFTTSKKVLEENSDFVFPPGMENAAPGVQERIIISTLRGEEPPLPFPTVTKMTSAGRPVNVYEIPMDKKAEVLNALYLFDDIPAMDEIMIDIHESKPFVVRDFIVTREDNFNYLCSPYYLHTEGTVLDWMPIHPNSSSNEEFEIDVKRVRE